MQRACCESAAGCRLHCWRPRCSPVASPSDRRRRAPLAWSALRTPAAPGSGEPRLTASPDGEVVLSWLEPNAEDYELKYSLLGTGGGAPLRRSRAVANFVVNPADFPSVNPITEELWAAHWLVSSPTSPFAYDIAIATSRDGGRHWGEPRLLNDDGTDAEHGFVTLFAWDGDVGAVWLDGRELAEFHDQDPTAPELETAPVGTNLRFARLDADATVIEQGVVDRLACDCCQTAVVVTERGPLSRIATARTTRFATSSFARMPTAAGRNPCGWGPTTGRSRDVP